MGFGLDMKLQGSVTANPSTGQLTATFANLPELPFQDFRLRIQGRPERGARQPADVRSAPTTTSLTHSALRELRGNAASTFTTSYDGDGAPCPAALPFAPSTAVSTASSQAGALSPLSVTFARADRDAAARADRRDTAEGPARLRLEGRAVRSRAGCGGHVSGRKPHRQRQHERGRGQRTADRAGLGLPRARLGRLPVHAVGRGAGGRRARTTSGTWSCWCGCRSTATAASRRISGPLPSILDGIPLDSARSRCRSTGPASR